MVCDRKISEYYFLVVRRRGLMNLSGCGFNSNKILRNVPQKCSTVRQMYVPKYNENISNN